VKHAASINDSTTPVQLQPGRRKISFEQQIKMFGPRPAVSFRYSGRAWGSQDCSKPLVARARCHEPSPLESLGASGSDSATEFAHPRIFGEPFMVSLAHRTEYAAEKYWNALEIRAICLNSCWNCASCLGTFHHYDTLKTITIPINEIHRRCRATAANLFTHDCVRLAWPHEEVIVPVHAFFSLSRRCSNERTNDDPVPIVGSLEKTSPASRFRLCRPGFELTLLPLLFNLSQNKPIVRTDIHKRHMTKDA
jgi:hypothetical protein